MNVYYVNHLNERIDLDSDNIILQYQELFNYSWDAVLRNDKIRGFQRKSATIPLKVAVIADDEKTYYEILEKIYITLEKDILSGIAGKLYVGGYYLKCFISGDRKADAFTGAPFQIKNLTLVTDLPRWHNTHEFHFAIQGVLTTDNKKYTYQYPYRYANGMNNTYIINPHFTDSNFKLILYGPVVNPQISIGGNTYLVNIVLEANERLEIDSSLGTVIKVMSTGEQVSAFHNRQKKRNFFKKIPPGRQSVVWPGNFAFDLILYEERSEPKWNTLQQP